MGNSKRSVFAQVAVSTLLAICATAAHATYLNVFNIEGESALSAAIVTYDTLTDMLSDSNRTGVFEPDPNGFGVNIVGAGSDGQDYWNVFNIEGESALSAAIVTYDTLTDMLSDSNRTGVFEPDPNGFGVNIVGAGSDGQDYWNVFNIEGESALSAAIVTYDTLTDMLSDSNRTGVFEPNPNGFGVNIVGGGAMVAAAAAVPEPGTLVLIGIGLAGLAFRVPNRPSRCGARGRIGTNRGRRD